MKEQSFASCGGCSLARGSMQTSLLPSLAPTFTWFKIAVLPLCAYHELATQTPVWPMAVLIHFNGTLFFFSILQRLLSNREQFLAKVSESVFKIHYWQIEKSVCAKVFRKLGFCPLFLEQKSKISWKPFGYVLSFSLLLNPRGLFSSRSFLCGDVFVDSTTIFWLLLTACLSRDRQRRVYLEEMHSTYLDCSFAFLCLWESVQVEGQVHSKVYLSAF